MKDNDETFLKIFVPNGHKVTLKQIVFFLYECTRTETIKKLDA